VLEECVLRSGRDEEDGSWSDRMELAADALFSTSPKVQQELSMGMLV
jgi:hypothetical protein